MKTYIVPVSILTTGWVRVLASDLEDAKKKANILNETEDMLPRMNDVENNSEVQTDAIQEM